MRVTNLLRWLPGISLLVLAMLPASAASPGAAGLPPVPDQWGQQIALSADSGQAQVAIVVAAQRLRRIKPWEESLRQAFPDLAIVRVADFPGGTTARYESVAVKLRKRLPEDVNVGIDLEGRWAKLLDIDTQVPNIIVFDRDGQEVARHSGMYHDDLFAPLAAELYALVGNSSAATVAARKDD